MQAARTITAFAVAILSCIVLWYSNPHKCASFFFAWQGLFPMQVRHISAILLICIHHRCMTTGLICPSLCVPDLSGGTVRKLSNPLCTWLTRAESRLNSSKSNTYTEWHSHQLEGDPALVSELRLHMPFSQLDCCKQACGSGSDTY